MNNIFISYRREDSADVTGRINDRLRLKYGEEAVFTDVDNIPFGVDFRSHLDHEVSQCKILLAVIGKNWLIAANDQGQPRLNDPTDFVRIEIESALQRNIPVIPLFVQGAGIPAEHDLPTSLRELIFRNGTKIRRDPDFHTDMDRLIKGLDQHLQADSKKEKYPKNISKTTSEGNTQENGQKILETEDKGDANIWNEKGNELYKLERYEEAISACDRAIEIKADFQKAIDLKKILEKKQT